jgi:hypothetical protein
MQLNKFTKDAGFKILALSGLSSPQYAIVLYLINCSASGMDEIITTHSEFASLMGYEEERTREALLSLLDKNMIRLQPSEASKNSIKISFEFEVSHWMIGPTQNLSPRDAVVFPFMSQKATNEKPIIHKQSVNSKLPAWETILNEYTQEQDSNSIDLPTEAKAAHLLADTHPIEQVSLILKHFRKRIKSLSLLASSWQHFQELFESETQKVDLDDARKKHHQLDEQLRKYALKHLDKAPDFNLTEDEIAVLKIIAYHQHPRRQLFWAYQVHERYPNLSTFFVDNADLMLSITTHGTLIKKTRPDKRDK